MRETELDAHTFRETQYLTQSKRRVLNRIHAMNRDDDDQHSADDEPSHAKAHRVRYTLRRASALVGRAVESIRDAEKRGLVAAPDLSPKSGRRIGYQLHQINALRRHFGTLPYRHDDDPPAIISVQNFKGGVGKSCMTTHLAHGFAIQGYRVLVIDADPQATTTSVFGFNPDLDIHADDTIGPYLLRDRPTLRPSIRKTPVDQVDLIPSQLRLNDAEYALAAQITRDPQILDWLRSGVHEIAEDYDIVLIDPPPALGMIPLSVLRAANALLVPVRPSMVDFASTLNFFDMLEEAIESLTRHAISPAFHWQRILINDLDTSKSMQRNITELMEETYAAKLLKTRVNDSAEIDNAAGRLCTVFELTEPSTSKSTRRRAMLNLQDLVDEVTQLIIGTWPGRQAALRQRGLL